MITRRPIAPHATPRKAPHATPLIAPHEAPRIALHEAPPGLARRPVRLRPGPFTRAARFVTLLVVRAWLKWHHRIEMSGRGNLPADGPFVLVANHASHLDVLCLLAALPVRDLPRTHPTASADYFFATRRLALVSSLLFNGMPFHRRAGGGAASPSAVRDSLDRCRRALAGTAGGGDRGGIVILFPEGSRSPDGTIRPFKRGVGLLVAGTDVPVIPCRLDGTFEAMPKGSRWPRPRRIQLTIGKPRTYATHRRGKAVAQQIARDLHSAVLELSPDGNTVRRPTALGRNDDEPQVHLAA
jgi:1-acyl-sn-glycerol-3-phosphate acyltransferase